MTLPEPLRLELTRLVDRWRVLPVDRAGLVMPAVADLLADLEEATAALEGRAPVPVPDLGPRAAMAQVTVLLQDWAAVASGTDDGAAWAARLAALRAATWGTA